MKEPLLCLFTTLFQCAKDANDLKGTALEGKPEQVVPLVNNAVDTLRDPHWTPNLHVNKIATVAWRLIANKITPTGITDAEALPAPGICFWGEVYPTHKVGMILIPHNWPDLCVQSMYMQMGGLIFNASAAADFYFDRLKDGWSKHRSAAYESEFLKVLLDRGVELNQWQKSVRAAMPNGLDSLKPEARYDLQEVIPGDFLLIDNFYKTKGA